MTEETDETSTSSEVSWEEITVESPISEVSSYMEVTVVDEEDIARQDGHRHSDIEVVLKPDTNRVMSDLTECAERKKRDKKQQSKKSRISELILGGKKKRSTKSKSKKEKSCKGEVAKRASLTKLGESRYEKMKQAKKCCKSESVLGYKETSTKSRGKTKRSNSPKKNKIKPNKSSKSPTKKEEGNQLESKKKGKTKDQKQDMVTPRTSNARQSWWRI